MIQKIILHTTNYANDVCALWNTVNPEEPKRNFETPDIIEMKAFLGIMYIRGVYKSSNVYISDLWSDLRGRPEFRATMSRNRYKELSRYVRFDDKNTREERKQKDKFAAIRELYEEFNEQCRANWELSDQITIEETLRRFRGRVAFKVYNPDKPAKYGILFRVLTDGVYRYVHRMMPYAGAPEDQEAAAAAKSMNTVPALVEQLLEDVLNTGRNVTMDRYYGHIALIQKLTGDHSITVVATMNINRVGVPVEMKKPSDREIRSSLFAWSDEMMMVNYIPKSNKSVLLVSTEHTT